MTAQQNIEADSWTVAGRTFTSRLIVGTGKYKSLEENAAAVEASGAEIVTVAVRRVNISDPSQPRLTDFIDPEKVTYLPNTAGCFTAEEAIRTLRLAREAGGWNLVKLEVLGEAKTLYPDMRETLRATEVLVQEGFEPMVYCVDDPIAAKQLEEAGAVAIMPLGAPIGSGLGIQNRVTIRLIVEGAGVPVLVDAGVGTASDAAQAMELGCDGVLMNTAIAEAKDPVLMARAMKAAVEAGRLAYLAGRMQKRRYADPEPASGAHLVAVTICADIGASKPFGPRTARADFESVKKTSVERAGAIFFELDAHRRAVAEAARGFVGGGARLVQLDGVDPDLVEPGGLQVALDPFGVVIAEWPRFMNMRRIVREMFDHRLMSEVAHRVALDGVPDGEQVMAAVAQHAPRLRVCP